MPKIADVPIVRAVAAVLACLVLALLAGCGAPDLDVSRKFQAAQEAFNHAAAPEDFLRAAALYQELLDAGIVSGAVLYDQGNAFMRAEKRGRAIAAYRRAQRYRPRDPYLEANLRLALGSDAAASSTAAGATSATGATTAGASLDGRRGFLDQLLFWQGWLSYPEKFDLLVGFSAVAFLLGLASLVRPGRPALRRAVVAALALALLAAVTVARDAYANDFVRHGVVVVKEVVARKGNATSYEPAFTAPLAEGAEFTLLEARGEWLLIRLSGGPEGWIPADAAVTY
ncbi:MAG: hypothetical protein HYZ53_21120 [Planctomycetes bacterium]|nr:hypothetical protein [Planctomycetota bacterium]